LNTAYKIHKNSYTIVVYAYLDILQTKISIIIMSKYISNVSKINIWCLDLCLEGSA
jgi:hypothetical protein